jgi:putative ABC transport system permease protein
MYMLRSLSKNPGFAVVAILTLGLGIGANTAIFSVVNAVLLRPLPYRYADRIVQVWGTNRDQEDGSHAPADFIDLQRSTRTLDVVAGYREDALTIAREGSEPVRETGALVTADYFEVFGTHASKGRTFNRAADAGTAQPLVVLSHNLWRDALASDPAVVGRLLRVNGVAHSVLGVMPDGFNYPLGAKAWVLSPKPVPPAPIDIPGELLETRGMHYFQAVGRLADGTSLDQANAELATIAAGIAQRFPQTNTARGLRAEPLYERIVGDVRQGLLVLLGAVGVVLLIACANVASLLLARASGRQRELAIRSALGASRARLARQLLGESLMLAVAGGLFGLLLGTWAVDLLLAVLPGGVPRVEQIGIDGQVAAASFGISLVSALLFGLIPSFHASRAETSSVLREAGDRASTGGRARTRARAMLVVAEVALTLVLLVSAALLANSFLRLQRTDPGFATDVVTLVQMPLPQSRYQDGKAQAAFYQRLLEGLQARGEIEMAAVVFPDPLSGSNAMASFDIEGQPPMTRADRPNSTIVAATPDYCRTMGIQLIAGRSFTDRDRPPAPTSVMINTTLARRYFSGVDPIGKRIRFDEESNDWMTIVGLVADSRNMGLDQEPAPQLFLPMHVFPLPFMNVVARSPGGVAGVASAVRAQVHAIDPELPVDTARPLSEVVHESVAEPRFRTLLLGGFAVTALVLAAIGVYGLISYSVTQRTREIGIRVALGASARQVVGPILREGLTLALAGIAIGAAGAVAATRFLESLLFGVAPTDPLTFAAVSGLLLLVAVIASYIPSRRALRVDPLVALKAE